MDIVRLWQERDEAGMSCDSQQGVCMSPETSAKCQAAQKLLHSAHKDIRLHAHKLGMADE